MKAIVYRRYGPPDVMRLEEVPRPEPGEDQLLVKIHRVSINAPDWRLMRASPFLARFHTGLLSPRFPTLGCDIAGTVEAVGPAARRFRAGDEVFGDLAHFGYGGFAEYACPSERALARKPKRVGFEAAAATPMAGMTALQGLRDHGGLRPGQSVLIVGASGGVGTFAVQIARLFGADVTAVCSSGKAALALRLGADRVIDYTREDFARGDRRYDLVFAINGYRTLAEYRRVLAPSGVYLMVGGRWPQLRDGLFLAPLWSLGSRQKFAPSVSRSSIRDLVHLGDLLEQGRIEPVIDRRYSLSEVPDAIRYVEEGHAAGKVIIEV